MILHPTGAAAQAKRCAHCRSPKPLEAFTLDRTQRDGRANRCRRCSIEATHLARYKAALLTQPLFDRDRALLARTMEQHRAEIAEKIDAILAAPRGPYTRRSARLAGGRQ
jgi:recombinational DNA repair protein (RecF pathway)